MEKTYEKMKPFKCDLCDKTFTDKYSLEKHCKIIHEKLKQFKCDICDKQFSAKNVLKRHKFAVHDKLFQFKCQFCTKEFKTSDNLYAHNQVHSEIKPYECLLCNSVLSVT